MNSFDNWKEEYGLQSEPNYSEHTEKDCKSAFEAGQQSQQAEIDELQKLLDKDGDIYRVPPIQMAYQGRNTQRQRSKDEFVALTQEWHTKGWNARQAEIDALKSKVQELWTEMDDRQSKEHIIEKCEAIIQEILK